MLKLFTEIEALRHTLKQMAKDESGATVVEYGVVLTIVLGAAIAIGLVATSVSTNFTAADTALQ